jgi:polysaccharide export outer membrane protein
MEIRCAARKLSAAGTRVLGAALIVSLAVGLSRADYRLAEGDVIEVAIAGTPEQRQRAWIQLDGTISIPGIGTVHVAGSTPSSVQVKIETMLATRSVRQKSPDARDRIVLVQPGDVAVTIVEYRPIYVTGDVLTPGQHAYRPTMTVRQALALCGGVSLVRSRTLPSNLEAVELDREYRMVAAELAKEHVRAWRLAAELEGTDSLRERPLGNLSVSAASIADFIRLENKYLQIRRSEFNNEKTFLLTAIRQADDQIAVLADQEQKEERGVEADTAELDRVNKLFGTGSLPSPRVTESRRAVLLSSTRRLQTASNLTEVKRQREDFVWRREKLSSQRELELLRETKESRSKIAELQMKLESAAEKLRLAGSAVSSAAPGDNPRAEITIIRKNGQQWDRISASEDSALEPGDAIEAALRSDPMSGVATR